MQGDYFSIHKMRADQELQEYSHLWDRISQKEAEELEELIQTWTIEGEAQQYLKEHPKFLIQTMSCGHGRYLIPKPQLGSQFEPDFLLAEMSSLGLYWHGIELESPLGKLYKRSGEPTSELNHALNQIRYWRNWLRKNSDYASRTRSEQGLGLVGIDDRLSGVVIMGRRSTYPTKFDDFRREMIDRERIWIHSYDWLIDTAKSNKSGQLHKALF